MNARVDPALAAGSEACPPPRGARFLLPGEWWFGAGSGAVSTLLGSCVAVTLWHPRRRLGGMCHYLLPHRRGGGAALDGRYGDEAIALLEQALACAATQPQDYEVRLVGGAHMFAHDARATIDIGARNAAHGRAVLQRHGFVLRAIDTGGTVHRRVELDLATGAVHVRAGA